MSYPGFKVAEILYIPSVQQYIYVNVPILIKDDFFKFVIYAKQSLQDITHGSFPGE